MRRIGTVFASPIVNLRRWIAAQRRCADRQSIVTASVGSISDQSPIALQPATRGPPAAAIKQSQHLHRGRVVHRHPEHDRRRADRNREDRDYDAPATTPPAQAYSITLSAAPSTVIVGGSATLTA